MERLREVLSIVERALREEDRLIIGGFIVCKIIDHQSISLRSRQLVS